MSTAIVAQIRAQLATLRGGAGGEIPLQEAIARALSAAGISFDREVAMTPQDRIDFLCGDVGIEVKVQGALASVTRQLHRYAQNVRIQHLLLVTTRMRHRAVPRRLNDKPVDVLHLIGSSL